MKRILLPTILTITTVPIISLVGCGDDKKPQPVKPVALSLDASEYNKVIDDKSQYRDPAVVYKFSISNFEANYKLTAQVANVTQVKCVSDTYPLQIDVSNENIEISDGFAYIPVYFCGGPLLKDNAQVKFDLNFACINTSTSKPVDIQTPTFNNLTMSYSFNIYGNDIQNKQQSISVSGDAVSSAYTLYSSVGFAIGEADNTKSVILTKNADDKFEICDLAFGIGVSVSGGVN